jgi:hypothetical protein
MNKNKLLGIWMDHSDAYLMELANDTIVTKRIVSETDHKDREDKWDGHEKGIHTKEQHQQSSYYRKIRDAILEYQKVVIFGPTDAKHELFNLLQTDHLFEDINIEVLNADKMTENQMHTFIREYFH